MTTDLIPRQTITMILENATVAREEIAQAFALLPQAKAQFRPQR